MTNRSSGFLAYEVILGTVFAILVTLTFIPFLAGNVTFLVRNISNTSSEVTDDSFGPMLWVFPLLLLAATAFGLYIAFFVSVTEPTEAKVEHIEQEPKKKWKITDWKLK